MIRINRKERERRRRREDIIDAAEEVIRERGFEASTMDEIAERAGVSKGSLYLHFENKMALFIAISERGARTLNSRFTDVLTLDMTGLELVKKLGRVYVEFVHENPLYFQAFAIYQSVQDEDFLSGNPIAAECEEHARQSLAIIVRCLQIGMKDGSVDDSYDPKVLALLIWASSRGVVQMAQLNRRGHHFSIIDGLDVNLDEMVPNLLRLLEMGMRGDRGDTGRNTEMDDE